jgi:hypothetical protein
MTDAESFRLDMMLYQIPHLRHPHRTQKKSQEPLPLPFYYMTFLLYFMERSKPFQWGWFFYRNQLLFWIPKSFLLDGFVSCTHLFFPSWHVPATYQDMIKEEWDSAHQLFIPDAYLPEANVWIVNESFMKSKCRILRQHAQCLSKSIWRDNDTTKIQDTSEPTGDETMLQGWDRILDIIGCSSKKQNIQNGRECLRYLQKTPLLPDTGSHVSSFSPTQILKKR